MKNKSLLWKNYDLNPQLKQSFRIMKTSFLLLLVCLSSVYANTAHSQNAKASINVRNSELEEVLNSIEKQTDYLFIFNDQVDVSQRVTVKAEKKAVAEILNQALSKTDIAYALEGKHIVLSKKEAGESANVAQQDDKKISGTIVDANGEAIIGASVVVKGTNIGTVSDMDGKFVLEVPAEGKIVVSYIGYNSQEVASGDNTSLKIKLTENIQALEEVIVVGYGTLRKGEVTSSIAKVNSESFVKGAVQDAAQLLQGKVAGLGIALTNGDPTATTQITLRGVGTLLSNSYPLIIIDGVPGDLTTVAPEDIESIDVVKDGSAAAIYGTRGNNGIIFITTKKIRGETPLSIEIHTYGMIQSIKKSLDMMDATQYRDLVKQEKPGAIDYGYDTNWLDEIMQTPFSWLTNVSLKGGTGKSNYIANVNYRSGQGIIKRSTNDVLTTRLEVNHNMWDKLLRLNLNIMGREQTYHAYAYNQSFREEIYRNALAYIPTDRPKDDKGNWVERPTMYEYNNPLAMINESDGENKNTQLRTFGSALLTPIESINIKALVSHTKFNESRGYSETKKHISTIRDKRNGYAAKGSAFSQEDMIELTAQYKERFEKHYVTGLLGYSYQNNIAESDQMNNRDFPDDQYTYHNIGAGAALKRGEAEMGSYKSKSTLIGVFARANYSYDNRYIASVSIRHEGSSKFGVDHKWGNFPAFSGGWNVSNENFMKAVNVISNLKIRAGFGVTGTVPNDPYISLSRLSTGDNFLVNGSYIPTLRPSSNDNPDLRWEKKTEWNLGVDFGFLRDRLFGSLDLYKRTTKDLLWDYVVPMPPYLYSSIIANAGTLENAGIEINIGVIPIQTSDFRWLSTVNYSTNTNKISSLSNEKFQVQSGYLNAGYLGSTIKQPTHRIFEGGKIGNFYGFKTIDIDEDGKWIIEGKDGKPKPIGNQLPDDKKVLGNGLPKHFLSWDNSFQYRGFDLNITMRGAFGYDILNEPRLNYDIPVNLAHGNLMTTAYDNKFGKRPLNDHQELQYVSYFIEDGSFWKIDNITLGYNFIVKNNYLKKIRVYTSGSNLFTFTGYSGIDPEVNFLGLDPGIDSRNRYPSTRSYTVGAIFTF
ncbi:SusC/RagA family TonB-linked outer membrane protein [Bacteroidales bacterium]|nr:SusC/RagA family TonB-linked outer membrane protein [Bacteroidales bacterium]